MMIRSSCHTLPTVALLLVAGCSGKPARVYPPKYALNCGDAAVAVYDKNGDHAIAGAELDLVPGLYAARKDVDANGDGRLTAGEIDERIQAWLASRMGEMAVNCEVTLDGKPLTGAKLVLDPEPFLGPNVHPASGETDESGAANVSMAPEHLADPRYRGMAAGWYKIRITHPSKDIPAQFNTETTLGCEVSMRAYWVNDGAIKLNLKTEPADK